MVDLSIWLEGFDGLFFLCGSSAQVDGMVDSSAESEDENLVDSKDSGWLMELLLRTEEFCVMQNHSKINS